MTTFEAPHRQARNRRLFTAGHCQPLVSFPHEEAFASAAQKDATGSTFLMADDVNASLIPMGFPAAAFYGNGPFANYLSVKARGCHVIAPTMLRAFSGDLKTIPERQHGVSWDCEPSLFLASQAGMLVHQTRSQGVFPHIYCPLSWAAAVCGSVKAAGYKYTDFGLHTAHWTYQPHICGGISTVFGVVSAMSTQFTDRYLNLSLDCSLCQPGYLGPFGGGGGGGNDSLPLKVGSQGNRVRRVQRALVARGFKLAQDGKFGPATEGAVRVWQREVAHPASGEVSHDDWAFMFPTLSVADKNHLPRATRALQTMLDWHGFHLSARDEYKPGTFGTATEGAVKEFQRNHGLTVDGVVGPNTWGKL